MIIWDFIIHMSNFYGLYIIITKIFNSIWQFNSFYFATKPEHESI